MNFIRICEWENFLQKWCFESWLMKQHRIYISFTILNNVQMFNRFITEKQHTNKIQEHAVENKVYILAEKVSMFQDCAFVFLWLYGDILLQILNATGNFQSAGLFGIVERCMRRYSPDLARVIFCLFSELKGQRFADIPDIQHYMTTFLKCILVNEFQEYFQQWQCRLEKCIASKERRVHSSQY